MVKSLSEMLGIGFDECSLFLVLKNLYVYELSISF